MYLICFEFHQTPIRLSKTTNLVYFKVLTWPCAKWLYIVMHWFLSISLVVARQSAAIVQTRTTTTETRRE